MLRLQGKGRHDVAVLKPHRKSWIHSQYGMSKYQDNILVLVSRATLSCTRGSSQKGHTNASAIIGNSGVRKIEHCVYRTGTGTKDLVLGHGVPVTLLYSYRSQPPKLY